MSFPPLTRFWRPLSILLSFRLLTLSSGYMEHKGDSPAVYIGKDLGWEVFDDGNRLYNPFPIVGDSWSRDSTTLYISIASFRDTLCPHTLFNIFSKSSFPKRISVGVVQQNAETDVDCLNRYCELMIESGMYAKESGGLCPFEKNIRIMRVPSSTAKGPTWGRAKASTLLRDEEFCMQTDAHMDFVPNWDVKMMKMWADTGNEYAVLSTYVSDASQLKYNIEEGSKGLNDHQEVPHLCMVTLDGANGLVRIWGTKCARNLPHPKMTNAIWGAGLSFSKCHAERKAPYDPHTPFIFDGEEFSRAIRFWTWGYDIYTPHRVYVVHNYKISQSDPNHFDWYRSAPDPSEGTLEQSVYRLKTLLEISGGATDPQERLALHQSKYGLGDRRTLDQAIAFSGVDTRHHLILGNRCGNIDFVPFKEHPFGPDYVPEFDAITEKFLGPRDPGSIYYNSSSTDSLKMWEDVISERQQQREQEIQKGLKINSKSEEVDIVTNNGLLGQKLSSVAHIVHISFGDGHGLHSQHEPDGSIVMVLFLLFFGILLNFFCRSKGKSSSISDEDSSYIKIV